MAERFFPDYQPEDPPPQMDNISVWNDLKVLWGDPGIQQAYERRSSFQLDDSAKSYVVASVPRVRADA